MARGITLRTLLIGLTLVFGLLVLSLALSGVADATRGSGIQLDWAQRSALERSLLSTQLVRGLIGIILALLLAGTIAAAASRQFAQRRTERADAIDGDPLWLTEAQDVADAFARTRLEHAERLAALTRRRADLDRLLEAVSEGILQLDAGGRIIRANRAAQRLLTLPEDAEGRQIGAVVRSADLRALLHRAAAEHDLPPREINFEERTLIVTVRALGPASAAFASAPPAGAPDAGAPYGLAVAIADLTALRRLEGVRRDFVANASHELKTPLTSIRGYAETLLDENLPAATRRQFIATISNNADRLQHIVDDLLDLSRLESGHWQPALARVEARAAIAEAWSDFTARAQQLGVTFDMRLASDRHLSADPSALRQILGNLFDNALRYTIAGDRIETRFVDWPLQPREAYARDRRMRYVAIEVRDSGAGIPGDALPRIFERFYRADPARSRTAGGTGLGLAIVKHLTESMGGSVEAESQLGRGTTIRIILPAASDRGADDASAA